LLRCMPEIDARAIAGASVFGQNRRTTARTSIQNNSGLPQGLAGHSAAG
jgi:hypothetical protein